MTITNQDLEGNIVSPHIYNVGDIVKLNVKTLATDVLPDPLLTNTTYYAVPIEPNVIRLALTAANAFAEPAITIDILDIGTGIVVNIPYVADAGPGTILEYVQPR